MDLFLSVKHYSQFCSRSQILQRNKFDIVIILFPVLYISCFGSRFYLNLTITEQTRIAKNSSKFSYFKGLLIILWPRLKWQLFFLSEFELPDQLVSAQLPVLKEFVSLILLLLIIEGFKTFYLYLLQFKNWIWIKINSKVLGKGIVLSSFSNYLCF